MSEVLMLQMSTTIQKQTQGQMKRKIKSSVL